MAKAEARVRDTTVWSVRRANLSASTLIPARTGSSQGFERTAACSYGRGGPLTPRGARNQLIHPGLGSFEERYQAACYSPVGVVGAAARRPALPGVDDCYGWPIGPQARLTIERHPRWRKRGAACFGGR